MSGSGSIGRTISKVITWIIVLLLVNEGFWYVFAWSRIALSARDAKATITTLAEANPGDSGGSQQAAAAAGAKYSTELIGFQHTVVDTNLGKRVELTYSYRTTVKNVLLTRGYREMTGIAGASVEGGGPYPTISFTFTPRIVSYQ